MANELVAQFTLGTVFKESSVGYDPWARSAPVGDAVGFRLHKLDTNGYIAICHIPGSLTMATGLTFTFLVALPDVPEFSSDLGKVVRLGVIAKRIISGESLDIDTGAGTEQTVDVTLQATAGLVTVATLAIAAANLDAAVVGDAVLFRVRRVSSAAQDTCQGSVLVPYMSIKNT